uniref:Cytochrome c biogenesis protein CcsA n=1 Tax=Kumanoa americana TaxID=1196377 RepID=A0A1C9CGM9_9FLOR|nr:cytochrome c biogenesis protein [Kumanoa americana]AOM67512.1 cytochrome c biogenesis protein [Kumanoa americana]
MTSNIIENNCVNISFALLLICLLSYWCDLTFPKIHWFKYTSKITTIIINILIGTSLGIRWVNMQYFPLSNLYESLLFLTWCLTCIQIILEQNTNSPIIGSLITPIELFIVAFASLSLPSDMQQASPLVPALRSNWLMMHVTIMMLSYSCLIIGSLLSILFLIIWKRQFKTILISNSGGLPVSKQTLISQEQTKFNNKARNKLYNRMNILESIDNLSYRIIGLGFPLLTIGIISGAVWANEAWGSYWSWDPKETWALITWLIFASYLHARLNKLWQGEKPAILASIGFLIVWICYLGVNFLGKGLHSYGWIP